MFVARSLSPAVVKSVKIEKGAGEKGKDKAIVTIAEDQKARAIGKVGLNIRLASMLTKCELELNVLEGATTNSSENTEDNNEKPTKDVSELASLFK